MGVPTYPVFALCYGISAISFRTIFGLLFHNGEVLDPMSMDVAGPDAIFLAASIFLWGGLHWMIEAGVFKRRSRDAYTEEFMGNQIDDDVEKEIERCNQVDKADCSVLVKNLVKVYS